MHINDNISKMTTVESVPQISKGQQLLSLPKHKHSRKKKGLNVVLHSAAITSLEIPWRGHGGGHPTFSGVEFDRQLDKISVWLEGWTHEQRCLVIEGLLRRSNYVQFQFLCTSLQPALHRDFMYTAKSQFPAIEFLPVSTHTSRKLKEKLIFTRQNNFHRIKSAHYSDAVQQSVKLPDIVGDTQQQNGVTQTDATEVIMPKMSSGYPLKKSRKLHHDTANKASSLQRWVGDGTNPVYASLPHIRYIDMPVRRHIQDENSPKLRSFLTTKSTTSLTSLQASNPSFHTNNPADSTGEFRENVKVKTKKLKSVSTSSLKPESPSEAEILYDWYTSDWSDVKRNEFLHKFLLKLDPREHYFVSSLIATRQHKDFIALLPEDIAVKILKYLSVPQLLTACRVSKAWHRLASTNEIWRCKCEQVRLEVRIQEDEDTDWKRVYRINKFLRVNWNSGVFTTTDLKGHTDNITCVTFDQNRLASGGLDKTIRLWDMKTGECTQVLTGHTKGVWCLNFFTQNLLISGGYDGTVRIFNLRSGKCTKTVIAHDGPVWAMVRHKDILVTASQDKTAKIWDIGRCHLKGTLHGHTAAIFAVDMNEDGSLVITGSADKSVKIWERETLRCKRWISVSNTTSVMAVSYSQGYLACSYGEFVCLYRVDGPSKLLKKYSEHTKRVETLKLDITDKGTGEGMIVSAGKDGKVIYWDVTKDESTQTFVGHEGEAVNAIYFDELRIASAAHDHKIRIWDFNIV